MQGASTQSITIAASPQAVMTVIADFAAYPQWTEAITDVAITDPGDGERAARARFAMDAGLVKDTYELAYRWSPDGLAVSWELVSSGIQRAQQGSYVLRSLSPTGEPPVTEVTYTLSVELTVPLVGALRRKAERTIMDTALTALRARVESAA